MYVNNGPSVNKAKVIKSDSLRILYYNARSLLPKLDDLSATIEAHNFPDIVCIVEDCKGSPSLPGLPPNNLFRSSSKQPSSAKASVACEVSKRYGAMGRKSKYSLHVEVCRLAGHKHRFGPKMVS